MYLLSEEQLAFKKELRAYCDAEIRPAAEELDRAGAFPRSLFARAGELGYLDISFSPARAGAKYGALAGTIILEEFSRGLPALSLAMSPHSQCCDIIAAAGTETLRRRALGPATRGAAVLAFALSEPSGGSDALGIDTTAVRRGGEWILNGRKCWITNAPVADGYIVAARSPAAGRSRSVSLFYVDRAAPGLTVYPAEEMIGVRCSPTSAIEMDDCRIPADCLVGEESSAYPLIKTMLNVGRLNMSALAVGISQAAMEATLRSTSVIGQYGRSLSSSQAVSFKVADMYSGIAMSRNSLYHVAALMEAGKPVTTDVAALKMFSTERCGEICAAARQLHGAKGLTTGSEVDRCFRDAQFLTIGEGTSEICRIVVSKALYRTEPGAL